MQQSTDAAYRKSLIETANFLISTRHDLFEHALQVALNNYLKEVDDAFEIGDTYQFHLAHFDNSDDTNLQEIVDLIKAIQRTVDSIIENNNIDNSDLTFDMYND